MPQRRISLLLGLHRLTWGLLGLVSDTVEGIWAGLWLGLLRREHFHKIDEATYARSKNYASPEHNLSGLFDWEKAAIETFFGESRRILLLGAGAGREISPLLDRGFEVDAFECHRGLREAGNQILKRADAIRPMERDRCPELEGKYEGIILGWGMLTLIPGRPTRRRLFEDLRAAAEPEAPMLLSFFLMPSGHRSYRIAHRLGWLLRRCLRREKLDFGDFLRPGFAHFFSRESLEEELEEAGWRLEFFSPHPYPHAVAKAGAEKKIG